MDVVSIDNMRHMLVPKYRKRFRFAINGCFRSLYNLIFAWIEIQIIKNATMGIKITNITTVSDMFKGFKTAQFSGFQ